MDRLDYVPHQLCCLFLKGFLFYNLYYIVQKEELDEILKSLDPCPKIILLEAFVLIIGTILKVTKLHKEYYSCIDIYTIASSSLTSLFLFAASVAIKQSIVINELDSLINFTIFVIVIFLLLRFYIFTLQCEKHA